MIEILFRQGLRKKPQPVLITATAPADMHHVTVISAGLPLLPELAIIAYWTEKGRTAAEFRGWWEVFKLRFFLRGFLE